MSRKDNIGYQIYNDYKNVFSTGKLDKNITTGLYFLSMCFLETVKSWPNFLSKMYV